MSNVESKSIIQRILEFINGGDEANVKNVVRVAVKKWEKQVALKTRAIKEIQEKLAEALEAQAEYQGDEELAYKEAFLNVDPEVKGRDNVIEYVNSVYEAQIAEAKYALVLRQGQIDNLKNQAEKAIAKLEKEIADYQSFLAEAK
jgi:hypothetical protein